MKNRSVVMPWDVLSVGASAADWWFCDDINVVMHWICQYLIVKKLWKHGQIMKNRSVVMPWDVLSGGLPQLIDGFVYTNLVMHWICQYLIVQMRWKHGKHNET